QTLPDVRHAERLSRNQRLVPNAGTASERGARQFPRPRRPRRACQTRRAEADRKSRMACLRFAPSAELVLPRRKRGVPARRSDRFLRPESPSRASNKAPRPTPRTLLWLRLRIKTAAIQRVIPLAQERTCEVGAQE